MATHLKLIELGSACRGLARSHVGNLVDAASVMLDRFHRPPARGVIELGREPEALTVSWAPPDRVLLATHANERDATEDGAYAVALSAAIRCGYVVRRRLHHGSGADYLLTRVGEPATDFVKLEVSGVARGASRLRARQRQKLAQLERGDLRRPGLAIVVGFEAMQVLVRACGGAS